MIGQKTSCDVCEIEKGETNHWLVAIEIADLKSASNRALVFFPSEVADRNFRPDATHTRKDLCGQACAHTLLSQWLETLTAINANEKQPANEGTKEKP